MGSARRRPRKQVQIQRRPEPVVIEKAVITTDTITVKDLSEKIGKPVAEIIKKLFMLGTIATINQELDFDTCELIASEYGITLEHQLAKTFEEVLTDSAAEEDIEENLATRPPVVTIMGHVDHGKTSLLDAIRHSRVTEGEAGGITQHIGAYTVDINGRSITFIDTPGHEAFTSMRARGAQVTDIVVLVVAADDGIMPQTVEAINHAKAAGVPIVVALNKMDRPEADPDRVKRQLMDYSLVSEEWGGDTICVPVSAKTKLGLDSLLEMILLQADVLELKANPNRLAKGTIIEAQLDKGRGPIATVLIQNGTLHVGDTIVAGTAYGRVRAMMDDKGRRVTDAGPSTPVEVLGFSEVPSAGDTLNVAEADKLSRQVAEERRDKIKAEQLKNLSKVSLDELFTQIAEGEVKDLNIIVKADVQGSVEAVKQALEKLSNDEVRVRCIHGGVGAITGFGYHVRLCLQRNRHRLQRAHGRRGPRHRRKRKGGCADVPYHLQRDRGCPERHEGHVQARIQGSGARPHLGARNLQGFGRGHHCGRLRAGGQGQSQRAGARGTRRRRRPRGQDLLAQALQGRRQGSRHGLRVRHRYRKLQRFAGWRHHRGVRHGGDQEVTRFPGRGTRSIKRRIMSAIRQDRLNEEIRKVVSEIIRDMKDPAFRP